MSVGGEPYPCFVEGSPLEAEHSDLLAALRPLVAHIAGFRRRLQRGEVTHYQHDLFAERAASLALHLTAAIRLAEEALYPSSFAVLRTVLEHQVLDHLYFLGARYKVVYRNVADATLADWRRQADHRDPGTEDIITIERQGRNVAVFRSGPHFTGGLRGPGAPSLSRYYGVLDEFDPFEPPPRLQRHLIGSFVSSVGERETRAARQRRRWYQDLTWQALRENLALNDFYTEGELVRWDVHYGFLSAFVHPTPRAVQAIYGRDLPAVSAKYDHYASELVLLYAHTFARLELEVLGAMASREPSVGLAGWGEVTRDIDVSRGMTEYFWFPGGEPTMFDRVEEANRRGVVDRKLVPMSERPRPDDIPVDEVRYYKNPLKRLIQMHHGINEMTGFAWQSMWPRHDAFRRGMDV